MTSLILVVDDIPTNLSLCKSALKNYRTCFAQSGPEALDRVKTEKPDLILLDVMMPGMNGYEVCRILKQDSEYCDIPIIFLTSLEDETNEAEGFEAGGVDYIIKPFSVSRLVARVRNQLSLVQMEQLEITQQLIVEKLGRAAEYKDNETGHHVIRMSHCSKILALAAGLSECEAELLFQAAPMHDVGKIGIPDYILLKEDKLCPQEWEIMKQHPLIGADIIGEHDIPLLQAAREIALTHHERWDGTGYPTGLKGEDIPLFGRIVAVADVFDALVSKRPYKLGWSVDDTCDKLRSDAGSHFDPELIDIFLSEDTLNKVKTIYKQWPDKS